MLLTVISGTNLFVSIWAASTAVEMALPLAFSVISAVPFWKQRQARHHVAHSWLLAHEDYAIARWRAHFTLKSFAPPFMFSGRVVSKAGGRSEARR